jgi:hypothetical protein
VHRFVEIDGPVQPATGLDLLGAPIDDRRVNKYALGTLFPVSMVCIALTGCATSAPSPVSIGNNTYVVTRTAKSGFTLDTDELKAEAMQDATKFCAAQGKQLKIVTLTEIKPKYYTQDFASVKIVFKALDAGDPELRSEPVLTERSGTSLSTDAVYDALNKLDDLRKRGILTEEEFQVEKQKVLSRSN